MGHIPGDEHTGDIVDYSQSLVPRICTPFSKNTLTDIHIRRHRGSIRSNIEGSRRSSKVEVFLALFVESGIISCCAWVSVLTLNGLVNHLHFSRNLT